MAMVAGTLYAVAANAVSYFAHLSKKTGEKLSKRQQLALDGGAFCTFLVGGLLATAAYSMGDPVPLLQGTLVATNLLLNMAFQICLGISLYTKAMRIGTLLCFVVVMFQLADVGPHPRGKDVNVIDMFSKTTAILWFMTLGALIILTGVGLRYTQSQSGESFTKVFAWALHIGVLGSATDNAASTFGVITGWILYSALAAYGLVSAYVLGMSAKAPAVCDASTYVPLQLSLQLVLNMITGILVWGDLDRMAGRPLQPYFVTVVVIIFSVYVASPSVDVVDALVRWNMLRKTNLSEEVASSTYGKSVLALVECWKKIQMAPGRESEDAAREALMSTLSLGAERGRLTSQDLVDLAVELYAGSGSFAVSAAFIGWLGNNSYFQTYLKHDPDFHQKLLDLMPASERHKLPVSLQSPGGPPSPMGDQSEMTISLSTS